MILNKVDDWVRLDMRDNKELYLSFECLKLIVDSYNISWKVYENLLSQIKIIKIRDKKIESLESRLLSNSKENV